MSKFPITDSEYTVSNHAPRFYYSAFISCGILRKEIECLQAKGDIDVETYFLSEKLHKDIGLEGLKNVLIDALDRNQKKCSANKEQIG